MCRFEVSAPTRARCDLVSCSLLCTARILDGEAFLAQAARKQAAGAVVSGAVDAAIPMIVVEDTLKALGELGASWRTQMPATVIGITGSNGKTTVKELLAELPVDDR